MKTTHQLLRLLAAATALSIASVHVAILNQHLEEQPYVGGLFLAAILALQFVALELAQQRRDRVLDRAAWLGGSAIVTSMFALFVVSRTIGLPGYREPWDAIGIASLTLEGLFVALAITNEAVVRIGRSHARIERGMRMDVDEVAEAA